MLIVIDGLDGSGKSTQFEMLQKRLDKKNIPFVPISFPDYAEPSSALVKMYLSGELSTTAEGVNPYASSSFYAVDRYASYKKYWEKDYKADKLIIASRYVSSNMIHQTSKLPNDEWDNFIEWICDYEYRKLELPEPDLVIFLDMPVEISQNLLTQRYNGNEKKKDIHEANVEYLKHCRETAMYTAKKRNWTVITCGAGGKPFPERSIADMIDRAIEKIISP